MKIENKPISELRPYKHNPKTHPNDQVERIAKSITEFGFLGPILIDADNSIIAGHGRLLAARKLGLSEIPTICVNHLSEAQVRAYRIADNKLAESKWDIDELVFETNELKDTNFDINLSGFDDIELGGMLELKEKHNNTFLPGKSAITKDIKFIGDATTALVADKNAQKIFKNKTTILISFSGGKDSSFALLWAKTNFPEKDIIAVFSDTGVELPGMVAHIRSCCEFFEVECKIVHPTNDMWVQVGKGGWPSIIFSWCQTQFIYNPINKLYLEYDPNDVVIIGGSRADQVSRLCKKDKTSKPSEKRMQNYEYYHPAFDVEKKVLEHLLENSGMPIWEGYARGFVRTACWMCPGMCGDQALALSENYPGLTEYIRTWERKIGKPLQQSNNNNIDDLIAIGKRNRDRRVAKSLIGEQT